ncbi:hypothetical protein EUX98_g3530 [Antrodiella citrinella]|uniref:Uncharacterized protein n=1 Tax=Antrodiella citrinella TaxID=2447956 RepID=A0A4S4MZ33_9APHY|nr:hypothetical protein EUX98_g3530 [Antrodiella citrinella]
MQHRIINNCNPDVPVIKLPDGREARLVIVDDRPGREVNYSQLPADSRNWFPKAQSDAVARKLARRIMYEGYNLPILTAIAGALLMERIRMRYRSAPIADFGICHGSARVVSEDRLTYYSMKDRKFTMGQDFNDHYWLYFTSIKGEEVYLDFAMFTFNFACLVNNAGYSASPFNGFITNVPCFWNEREIQKRCVNLHTERSRVSVLRNQKLQDAARHCIDHVTESGFNAFYSFMESFSKKKMSEQEKGAVQYLIGFELDPNGSMEGLSWGAH